MIYKPKRPNDGPHGAQTGPHGGHTGPHGLGATGTGTGTLTGCGTIGCGNRKLEIENFK